MSLCEVCDPSPSGAHAATWRCVECEQKMCHSVAQAHRRLKFTAKHRLIALPAAAASASSAVDTSVVSSSDAGDSNCDSSSSASPTLCINHRQPFVKYDRSCRQLLCVNCQLQSDHRSCRSVDLLDEWHTIIPATLSSSSLGATSVHSSNQHPLAPTVLFSAATKRLQRITQSLDEIEQACSVIDASRDEAKTQMDAHFDKVRFQ